jgi:hypothetical protein
MKPDMMLCHSTFVLYLNKSAEECHRPLHGSDIDTHIVEHNRFIYFPKYHFPTSPSVHIQLATFITLISLVCIQYILDFLACL